MQVKKRTITDIIRTEGILLFLAVPFLRPFDIFFLLLSNESNLAILPIYIGKFIIFIIILIRFLYVLKFKNKYYILTPGLRASRRLVLGSSIGLPDKFKDLTEKQQAKLASGQFVNLSDLVGSSYNLDKDDPFKQDDCKYNIDKDDPFEDFYKKG